MMWAYIIIWQLLSPFSKCSTTSEMEYNSTGSGVCMFMTSRTEDTLSTLPYSSHLPLSQCSLRSEDFDPRVHQNKDLIMMQLVLLILFATIVSQPSMACLQLPVLQPSNPQTTGASTSVTSPAPTSTSESAMFSDPTLTSTTTSPTTTTTTLSTPAATSTTTATGCFCFFPVDWAFAFLWI